MLQTSQKTNLKKDQSVSQKSSEQIVKDFSSQLDQFIDNKATFPESGKDFEQLKKQAQMVGELIGKESVLNPYFKSIDKKIESLMKIQSEKIKKEFQLPFAPEMSTPASSISNSFRDGYIEGSIKSLK